MQTASEHTLESAEGVYVTQKEPWKILVEPGSMARFVALRSLWLRQVNLFTLTRGPGLPPSLRRGTGLTWHESPLLPSTQW